MSVMVKPSDSKNEFVLNKFFRSNNYGANADHSLVTSDDEIDLPAEQLVATLTKKQRKKLLKFVFILKFILCFLLK